MGVIHRYKYHYSSTRGSQLKGILKHKRLQVLESNEIELLKEPRGPGNLWAGKWTIDILGRDPSTGLKEYYLSALSVQRKTKKIPSETNLIIPAAAFAWYMAKSVVGSFWYRKKLSPRSQISLGKGNAFFKTLFTGLYKVKR